MEYLIVDRQKWVVLDIGTKPIGMFKENWQKMERKVRSTIQFHLSNLMLLNVSREESTNKL